MDDVRIGAALRVIRIRKRMRQSDVAERAGLSRQVVSRLERGAVGRYPLDTTRSVAGALGIRLEIRPRWQGAELDRVLNATHAELHESVAAHLGRLDGWAWLPEVTFAHFGERGVIDILAWHAESRSLLIIELKTELGDPAGAGSHDASTGASRTHHRRGPGLGTAHGERLGDRA